MAQSSYQTQMKNVLARLKRTHPEMNSHDRLHYMRTKDPEGKRIVKQHAIAEKHWGRVEKLQQKAGNMVKKMKPNEIKKVGRTRYGNVVIKKGAGQAFTIVSPVNKDLVNVRYHHDSSHEYSTDSNSNHSKSEGIVKEFSKAMFGGKKNGNKAKTGKSGG